MEAARAITTMRSSESSKKILKEIVDEGFLSPTGLRWIAEVTDVFHDKDLDPVGEPDLTTAKTIVEVFTYTTTVSAPASSGTNTWDCQTLFCPVSPAATGTQLLLPVNYTSNTGVLTSVGTGVPLGAGWNAIACNAGTDLFSGVTANLSANGSLYMPNAMIGSEFRLVASGLEVKNTTPPLYKGGSATAWRSPNCRPSTSYCYLAAATTTLPTTVMMGNAPPTSLAVAQLYPTSRTWGAEDGVYMTVSRDDQNNPLLPTTLTPPPLFVSLPTQAQAAGANILPAWSINNIVAGTGGVQQNNSSQLLAQMVPFNWQGTIFSGLNANSTLQITSRYVIERAPSVQEQQFMVLAKCAANYDPMAYAIYTRAICSLPVGVPVGMNPLGEWWDEVLESVAENAPNVGAAFGAPGMLVGQAVRGAARLMQRERKKKKPQRENTLNNNQLVEPKGRSKAANVQLAPARTKVIFPMGAPVTRKHRANNNKPYAPAGGRVYYPNRASVLVVKRKRRRRNSF